MQKRLVPCLILALTQCACAHLDLQGDASPSLAGSGGGTPRGTITVDMPAGAQPVRLDVAPRSDGYVIGAPVSLGDGKREDGIESLVGIAVRGEEMLAGLHFNWKF